MVMYLIAGSLCALFFSGFGWVISCFAFIFGVLSFRSFMKDGEKEAKKKAEEDEIWRKKVAIENAKYEKKIKVELEEHRARQKELKEWYGS